MKDYTEEQLRDGRPNQIGVGKGIQFCLSALFADKEHYFEEGIVKGLSFEELLGVLLLMEDTIKEMAAWEEKVSLVIDESEDDEQYAEKLGRLLFERPRINKE